MFRVLNLFRSLFWKDVTNPAVLVVTGMNDNRRSSLKSRTLGKNCNIKKASVANKETVRTRMKMLLLPVRTARVLFCPFLSLSMSGASRLRLRKNPYSMKGTDRLTKIGSSCPFTDRYPTLGMMKPVAVAMVNSPKPREHNRMGGAEYVQPRRFAAKVMTRNIKGAPKKKTSIADSTLDSTSNVNEMFFVSGRSCGLLTRIFLPEKNFCVFTLESSSTSK
jgi:hypothetical protein